MNSSSSARLFVGGLPYAADDTDLRTAFSQYGEVTDAKVILDRETGRSRGFGFVTFATPEEAEAAVAGMDGGELGGRRVTVKTAEDRGPRRPPSPTRSGAPVIEVRGRPPRPPSPGGGGGGPRPERFAGGGFPEPEGAFPPGDPWGDGSGKSDRRRRNRKGRGKEERWDDRDDAAREDRAGGSSRRRRQFYDEEEDW